MTEYALFFFILAGVAIMTFSVYSDKNSEMVPGASSAAPEVE